MLQLRPHLSPPRPLSSWTGDPQAKTAEWFGGVQVVGSPPPRRPAVGQLPGRPPQAHQLDLPGLVAGAAQQQGLGLGVERGRQHRLALARHVVVEQLQRRHPVGLRLHAPSVRSEEHTSELQSLMRISYAVFCLKKKNKIKQYTVHYYTLTNMKH